MNQTFLKTILVIFVVAIFLFIATFSWFMLFKERVCKVSLFTTACGETYQSFMQNEFRTIVR